MIVGFYFDEHMPRSVAKSLAERGYEVIMAVDVDMVDKDDDDEHLPYATQRGLVMVTFDRPFAGRTSKRTDHAGVICLAEDIRDRFGRQIRTLAEFAETHSAGEAKGRVFWLG